MDPTLPTIRDPSHLSDTRKVSIGAHISPSGSRSSYIRFKLQFVRSGNAIISFDKRSGTFPHPSDYSPDRSLDLLNEIETSSVETMCFYRFQNHPQTHIPGAAETDNLGMRFYPFLRCLNAMRAMVPYTPVIHSNRVSHNFGPGWYDLVDRVQEVARLRSEAGSHLTTLILIFRGTWESSAEQELRERRVELEQLRSYVGWLEVVTGDEALSWDINKYFLGDHGSFLSKSNV